MIIIGLTGSIASGKSTIAKHIKKLKIPIHESDYFISCLYKKPTREFMQKLKKIGFANAIKKNKIDKSALREIFFNNKNKKKLLEKYLHHKVKKDRNKFVEKNKKQKIVFLDIPLLFEKKLEHTCDYVLCAYAPLSIRERRATQRKGMNKQLFNLISSNQIKDSEKKTKSDYIINTTLTKPKTFAKVEKILKNITKQTK